MRCMLRSSISRSAAVLAVCGFSAGCLGDHFFRATGRVVDCTALTPVADATITINIDRGDNPGPYVSGYTTSAAGQFDVHTAVSGGSWVTLTFEKAGYAPLSSQFQGTPKTPAELCMTPAAGP